MGFFARHFRRSSIEGVMHKGGRAGVGAGTELLPPDPPSFSSSEDVQSSNGGKEEGMTVRRCQYRSQLELEVQNLQKDLQEEINLHVTLANAVQYNAVTLLNSTTSHQHEVHKLLANIASLETTVSKLEGDLLALSFQLSQERDTRHLAECYSNHLLFASAEQPCSSNHSWEQNLSSLRVSQYNQISHPLQPDLFSSTGHKQTTAVNRPSVICSKKEASRSCSMGKEATILDASYQGADESADLCNRIITGNTWDHPNQLSEEMVRCMKSIFLCLSNSSTGSSKVPSIEFSVSPSSPVGNFFSTSLSHSGITPSLMHSLSVASRHCYGFQEPDDKFDPYRVYGKLNWHNTGSYRLATEVSWMTVGKKQLDYAAEALKRFRFLVEQLAKVNPARLSCNERLAFWINLYNALMMHAYLAYGVPRSEIKLFLLMQKASYTVGGQSFSAADIEYIILKMKPPAFRPQIALILAHHKFNVSEEHRKYAIDDPEPLAVFALSCGMHSSPAVKVYLADNVVEELRSSMRDYVRASVGIDDRGRLLVPKLLHCFAEGVVVDSLLVDWICQFLSPEQVAEVKGPPATAQERKQRLLGARGFGIIPFDSRFRYLFLPEDGIDIDGSGELSCCQSSS